MGCECWNFFKSIFRKKSDDFNFGNYEYFSITENNSENDAKNLETAKKVVRICLSEDHYEYRKYLDIILNFEKEDFWKLFEGLIDNKEDLYYKYNIDNEGNYFYNLIAKFENFQTILTQWYKDSKYYEYLKKLWIKFPLMSKLKDYYNSEYELSMYLKDIQYNEWEEDIKEEFKVCIRNSSEFKSCEISNFIKRDYPELENLFKNILSYRKKLGKQKNIDMKDYEDNFLALGKNLIKDFVENKLSNKDEKLEIKGSDALKTGIQNKIQSFLFEEYDQEDIDESLIDPRKISKLAQLIKSGNLINDIQNTFKFLKGVDILGGITLGLSLLNLCNEIYIFYNSFNEYDNTNDKFRERLNIIKQNFNEHKKIGILPENYYEAINRIIEVITNIKKDYEEVIDLINEIDESIENKKNEKKKFGKKIVKNIAKVGFAAAGAVVTSGLGAIACGIGMVASGIGIIRNARRFHKQKKQIKKLKLTREDSAELKNSISFELNDLYELYCKLSKNHFPSDYKDEGDEYYIDDGNNEDEEDEKFY